MANISAETDYRERLSAFADALVDAQKAFTAYESFREGNKDFDRLERAVEELSYSLQKLSWSRRNFKKGLAKKA